MTLGFFSPQDVSFWELFLILFILYIFFGVKTIPRLFRSLKKRWSELREALHEVKKEF